MTNEFYLTLPSNSSLADFPNNSSNNFKVRLPTAIRLNGEWKVALASILVPDPKNALPSWLTDSLPLVYASWYNADSSHSSKHLLDASFLLSDIKDHVDINRLTGISSHRRSELAGLRISCILIWISHILMWISCILIRYRFTNERRSSTIQTIRLPKLAR